MNLKYIILSNPYKDSLSVLRPILEMKKTKVEPETSFGSTVIFLGNWSLWPFQ